MEKQLVTEHRTPKTEHRSSGRIPRQSSGQALRHGSGQAMILAVLMLGGAILGVTAIAGLLMLYQIRQSTDFRNSATSIFAADTGVEWAFYNFFQSAEPMPTFANGATMLVVCYDNTDTPIDCTNASSSYVIAKGTVGDAKRAFYADLVDATSTFP